MEIRWKWPKWTDIENTALDKLHLQSHHNCLLLIDTSLDMATTIGLSLNDLLSQLMEAIFAGAAIVHYVHALQAFTYFLPGDRSMYAKEMKLLRKQLLNGIIVDVRAGDDFHINGKTLFPLDVKFDGRECHAYMLLRQQGDFADSMYTPYFFSNKVKRDEFLMWLLRE